MLRIILKNNFNYNSFSIYNDKGDISKFKDVSEIVGHLNFPWDSITSNTFQIKESDFENLRYKSKKLVFIKTHSGYTNDFKKDKAIYIYRDGRSALRSYSAYLHKFTDKNKKEIEYLDELLNGKTPEYTTNWNDHITSWSKHPQNKILWVKFENLLTNFERELERISKFIEINPVRNKPIPFQVLNSINSNFFRKGEKKSWTDLFDEKRHLLFWILNYKVMDALGYSSDRPKMLSTIIHNFKNNTNHDENMYKAISNYTKIINKNS